MHTILKNWSVESDDQYKSENLQKKKKRKERKEEKKKNS